jgi:hypothetical protein
MFYETSQMRRSAYSLLGWLVTVGASLGQEQPAAPAKPVDMIPAIKTYTESEVAAICAAVVAVSRASVPAAPAPQPPSPAATPAPAPPALEPAVAKSTLLEEQTLKAEFKADAGVYTKISSADLSIETNRYIGSKIEIKAACMKADDDDYRCWTGKGRVDFKDVSNSAGEQYLTDRCSGANAMEKQACLVVIRGVYKSWSRQTGPMTAFTNVKLSDVKIVIKGSY